ncbi:putative secreted protein (Por secretion system target) [Pontibacter ummariensis]|uniref:Por secretion system C-terminal sorting domain-containing protein n=1 Tax=Pontibacter ummariensis TaxID=1610492 RepID=A0A239KRF1_9BACT|nr:two-component regulator propeller domain-containing protein [Pontibacter ummariensis]PRY05387.1 putative secreted protein (Por secretion system target) [Pontibacter ummariensis]SNT20312.1 Por secretion system C-terminal sorting domain-containing protein [Pontibacter ummariensis]
MKTALLLLFTFLISLLSFGQGRWIDHTSQAALPSLNVRDVLVDSKGNKWFATDNGLTKFDGTNWTTFKAVYQGLRNNDIYALAEGQDGKIWVVTAQDIETFDGAVWEYYDGNDGLLTSTMPNSRYLSIHVAMDGTVWAGSLGGVSHFDGDSWENITDINGISLRYIADIEHDDAGNIWFSLHQQGYEADYVPGIVKYNGITWEAFDLSEETGGYSAFMLNNINGVLWAGQPSYIYKYANGGFTKFNIDLTASGIDNFHLSGEITQDINGVIWIYGTTNESSGLIKTGFVKYDGEIWSFQGFPEVYGVTSTEVDGSFIWVSGRNGAHKVNSGTNTLTNIGTRYGLSGNNAQTLFIDASDNVWIATGAGVERFNGEELIKNEINTVNSIFDIFQDTRENVWFVPRWNNDVYVRSQNGIETFNSTNSLLRDQTIYEAATDKAGNVYFAYCAYDGQGNATGTIVMYDGNQWYNITNQHPNLNDEINKIYATSDGRVWFFGKKGTVIKDGSLWTVNETLPPGALSAVESENGSLWLGYNESRLLHYSAGTITEYDLETLAGTSNFHSLNDLAIDYKGNLWVGGFFQSPNSEPEDYPGLARFNGSSWQSFSKADGLVSDAVTSIETDLSGNVWIGTLYGGVSQLILFSEIVTVSTSNISCHGGNNGSIAITPEGSNAPYRFSIDGGKTFVSENEFSGLTAGNYHILVKDGEGLTAHDEIITLTQPAGVFTWKVSPVSCAGAKDGAIMLSVQNDGTQISYVWHNADGREIATTKDIAALAGGTYSVTASYGDCIVTKTIVVPEPSPLQATLEHLNSCGDAVSGQITVRTVGGTAPFNYSIDGGVTFQTEKTFSGLPVGSYQIIVQDASGCLFTTASVTINQQEKPVPVVTSSGNLALCTGSSVWLKTTQKYEGYEWYDRNGNILSTQDSLEVTTAGIFYTVVYQNQCQATSATVTTTMVTTYDQQAVCIVTVDATTRKNKIVWSKIAGKHVASYNIYKETGTNQYSLIGNVPSSSNNYFIDEASAPMTASERYSVSIMDICGRESAKSAAHKTIYLQANLGVNNSVNLSWDSYEGFSYTQVNVLRGSSVDALQVLATRPANNNTFTDTSPNSAEMVYVIEAVTGYTCEGTSGESALGNQRVLLQNASTRSNPSSAKGTLGVEEGLSIAAGLKVYPNPTESGFTVDLKAGKTIYYIKLLDISGRVVQEVPVSGSKSSVHFERKAKAGLYILEVNDSQGQIYRQRVILQ